MSGSEAEERIRAKAEAALRAAWPDARIIHELMLRQGGCRIDLAAVTPGRLICVEIKSERDVLDRLERQLAEAREVADLVVVITAEKHLKKAREVARYGECWDEDDIRFDGMYGGVHRTVNAATTNAPARLGMLWASELRIVAEAPRRSARQSSIVMAADNFPGAEVRRRVCAALRARTFARADPPVLSDLFPVASVGAL